MPHAVGPNKYIIYGLVDPDTRLIRYVGKSSSGLRRPRQHLSKQNKAKTHCANWVRYLTKLGKRPDVVVLQLSSYDALNSDEKWWILYGRLSRWALTNLTEGGEVSNGYKHSVDTKQVLSALTKARLSTPEGKQKHVIAHNTPEYKKLASELAQAHRKKDPGVMVSGKNNIAKQPLIRKKISDSKKGKPRSLETKLKLSEAYYKRRRTEKELNYLNRNLGRVYECGTVASYSNAKRKASLGQAGCGPCDLCREAYNTYVRVRYHDNKSKL